METKKRRIYTMLRNGMKWTNDSSLYSRVTRNEMHVLACSIKQAYYLANNDCWYEEMGKTGIIALRDADRDDGYQWKVACIDDRQGYPPFKYGYVMSDKREQEFWLKIKNLKTLEFAKWRDFHSTGGEGSEDLYPVFECVAYNNKHLLFNCPSCHQVILHGVDKEFGKANGSRTPHCGCWQRYGQYFLREVKGKWIGGYQKGHIQKDE